MKIAEKKTPQQQFEDSQDSGGSSQTKMKQHNKNVKC
jgi:hypothetical protein